MNPQDQKPTKRSFSDDVAPSQCPGDTDSPSQRKPYVRKAWRSVAIIAATCIVLTGLVFVWLCIDFHPHKSLEKMGAVTFNDQGFENLSSVPGYPFTFDVQEDIPMSWKVYVNHYGFTLMQKQPSGGSRDLYVGNEITIDDGETIYWSKYDDTGFMDLPEDDKRIFMEAVLYSEDHIMGYCVIEIFINDPVGKYSAKMIDSAYYPQQNGNYQDIKTEYVQEEIEKAKK